MAVAESTPPSKTCRACGATKPLSAFHKRQNRCKACADTSTRVCKTCGEIKPRGAFERHKHVCLDCRTATERTCNTCGETKPVSEFRPQRPQCLACAHATAQSYYLEHLPQHRARMQAYNGQPAIKAKNKARAHGYYIKNARHIQAHNRDYNHTHPERIRAIQARHAERHPEAHAGYASTRRARIAQAPVNDVTEAERERVLAAAQGRCVYCPHYKPDCPLCPKGKHTDLTVDHITAISEGGAHTLHNLIACCGSCNSKKHTAPPPLPVQPLLL